jgi:hypothetical protein
MRGNKQPEADCMLGLHSYCPPDTSLTSRQTRKPSAYTVLTFLYHGRITTNSTCTYCQLSKRHRPSPHGRISAPSEHDWPPASEEEPRLTPHLPLALGKIGYDPIFFSFLFYTGCHSTLLTCSVIPLRDPLPTIPTPNQHPPNNPTSSCGLPSRRGISFASCQARWIPL